MADESELTSQTNSEASSPPETIKLTPELNNFNAIFTDIRKFNKQFSMGSIMANLFLQHVTSDKQDPTPSQVDERSQQLTASGIQMIHQGILDKTGIEIEPVSGKTAKLFGMGQEIGQGEIRLNVSDRNKFLNFLRSVDEKPAQNQELKDNLSSLVKILTQQIYDHYDLSKPSDEALNLLAGMGGIIDEYKRLGVEGTDHLEVYFSHSQQGDLREYISAEHQGLLNPPKEYYLGPGYRHFDTTPEWVLKDWQQAFDTLHLIQQNPNARELYEQVYDNLSKGLETMAQNIEDYYYTPRPEESDEMKELRTKWKTEYRQVLQEIKQAFG